MIQKNINIKVSKLNIIYIFLALTSTIILLYLGMAGKVLWLKELTDLAYGDILVIFVTMEFFHLIYFIHTRIFRAIE